MAGRRSKYTPDVVQRIVQAIELGATYELAAGYAGISPDTFTNWKNRYSDFSDAVKAAEGRAAVKWLAKIEQAASDGTWQAAAWKLERRYARDYGRMVHEHQGTVDVRRIAAEVAAEQGVPIELALEAADRVAGGGKP